MGGDKLIHAVPYLAANKRVLHVTDYGYSLYMLSGSRV